MAKTKPIVVIATAWALLDHASQDENRGDVAGFDCDAWAAFAGVTSDDVANIIGALQETGRIVDNRWKSWHKRQPIREDNSAERTRKYRSRKRAVTQCDAPDTDTDTDTDTDIKQNARASFDIWWKLYPHKVGKKDAEKVFATVIKTISFEALCEGVEDYIRDKPDDRQWCNPATWLRQGRWDDKPAPNGKMGWGETAKGMMDDEERYSEPRVISDGGPSKPDAKRH
jgi:hypothetical protein